MDELQMHRIGIIMRSEPGNDMEVEGVLNPAVIRGPDGELYLFPRLVAKGNYSRIGIAKVIFDAKGNPVDVKRLGVVLEPEADYEKRPEGGGCEDPRITYFEPIQQYIMTYTAFSSKGPRIALAISKDLLHWERLGLADFANYKLITFNDVYNKDACIFPKSITSPHGDTSMVMLHRPLFPGTTPEDIMCDNEDRRIRDHHECIWISYSDMMLNGNKAEHLQEFESNSPLALPEADWEKIKIGAGTPPVMCRHGWLVIYHGVHQTLPVNNEPHHLVYSAGLMILDKDHPDKILYRSASPVLKPELLEERVGIVQSVVFPTGIDRRDDLGTPNRFDVYYGMADNCIGVAQLDIPDVLPRM
ncbi:MAG: glycosidase [Mucilaginibacter sp.]|nr:MAG: glycosidase [Mucilaginibacter sp. 44-25]PMP65286.1 MAG: glycosidase [Mucilaginibacter sp.]HEK19612.1 glycosidase [Bacteroidota bacterium]